MFSRRLVVPGKVFVANGRNGITKPVFSSYEISGTWKLEQQNNKGFWRNVWFQAYGATGKSQQEDMEKGLCISFLCPLQKYTLDYSCLGKFSVKQDFYWKTFAFNTFRYVWS